MVLGLREMLKVVLRGSGFGETGMIRGLVGPWKTMG